MKDNTIKRVIFIGFFLSIISMIAAWFLEIGVFTAFQWVVIPISFLSFLLLIRVQDQTLMKTLKKAYLIFYGSIAFLYVFIIVLVILIFSGSN
jgi:amino acid permease